MNEERIKKLPLWAQARIESLEEACSSPTIPVTIHFPTDDEQIVPVATLVMALPNKGDTMRFEDSDREPNYLLGNVTAIVHHERDGELAIDIYTTKP